MAPTVRTAARIILVWRVAVSACIETASNAFISFLRHAWPEAVVWTAATLLTPAVAHQIESVNVFLDQ